MRLKIKHLSTSLCLPPGALWPSTPCLLLTPLRSHLPSPCHLPLLSAPLGSPSAPLPFTLWCPSKMSSPLHFPLDIFYDIYAEALFRRYMYCNYWNISSWSCKNIRTQKYNNIFIYPKSQDVWTLNYTVRFDGDCGRLGDKKVFKLNFPEFFCLYKIKWHCSAGTPSCSEKQPLSWLF